MYCIIVNLAVLYDLLDIFYFSMINVYLVCLPYRLPTCYANGHPGASGHWAEGVSSKYLVHTCHCNVANTVNFHYWM